MAIAVAGCGYLDLNPAFVDLLDPTGSEGLATLDNAPGHVVIGFVNNADVDERLLDYLESAEGGNLVLTEAQRQLLRPRMRLRVRITFTDGSFQTVEFIEGSSELVDPRFNAQSVPDLSQNDLNNVVVVCNVASVELEAGTGIDVFIPVEITAYELIESTGAGGTPGVTYEPRERIPPQFRTLQVDDVDEDGNVTLQRNIGVRDVPSPGFSPLCGSIVVIEAQGVLSVPFLDGVSTAPSYDRADVPTEAGIGGRYKFLTSVQ